MRVRLVNLDVECNLNGNILGPVNVCHNSYSTPKGSASAPWHVKFWQTYANAFPFESFCAITSVVGLVDCKNSLSLGFDSSIRKTCDKIAFQLTRDSYLQIELLLAKKHALFYNKLQTKSLECSYKHLHTTRISS